MISSNVRHWQNDEGRLEDNRARLAAHPYGDCYGASRDPYLRSQMNFRRDTLRALRGEGMSRTDFRKSLRVAFASCTSAGIPMKAKMIDIAKRRAPPPEKRLPQDLDVPAEKWHKLFFKLQARENHRARVRLADPGCPKVVAPYMNPRHKTPTPLLRLPPQKPSSPLTGLQKYVDRIPDTLRQPRTPPRKSRRQPALLNYVLKTRAHKLSGDKPAGLQPPKEFRWWVEDFPKYTPRHTPPNRFAPRTPILSPRNPYCYGVSHGARALLGATSVEPITTDSVLGAPSEWPATICRKNKYGTSAPLPPRFRTGRNTPLTFITALADGLSFLGSERENGVQELVLAQLDGARRRAARVLVWPSGRAIAHWLAHAPIALEIRRKRTLGVSSGQILKARLEAAEKARSAGPATGKAKGAPKAAPSKEAVRKKETAKKKDAAKDSAKAAVKRSIAATKKTAAATTKTKKTAVVVKGARGEKSAVPTDGVPPSLQHSLWFGWRDDSEEDRMDVCDPH